MTKDDVLQRAQELLERSAALQRKMEEFYQREAELARALEPNRIDPAATVEPAEDEHTD